MWYIKIDLSLNLRKIGFCFDTIIVRNYFVLRTYTGDTAGYCRFFSECWLNQQTIGNSDTAVYDVNCDYGNIVFFLTSGSHRAMFFFIPNTRSVHLKRHIEGDFKNKNVKRKQSEVSYIFFINYGV